MVVKVKRKLEKTRHVKKMINQKKYVLRGERNSRYYDRILSNKHKNNNLTHFTISLNLIILPIFIR